MINQKTVATLAHLPNCNEINSSQTDPRPLDTDAQILSQVVYASPDEWGTDREEAAFGHLVQALLGDNPVQMYLLAWPDGVRAMLSSTSLPGTPEMDEAVVATYRAAAGGYIGEINVWGAS